MSEIKVLAWPARRKKKDNPYSYLVQESTARHRVQTEEFCVRNLLTQRWDVIHVHWPEMAVNGGSSLSALSKSLVLLSFLKVHRRLGSSLIWTIHNIEPHEQGGSISAWYLNEFVSMVDGVLSPSATGLDLAIRKYPALGGLPSAVARIGHYRNFYGGVQDKGSARESLGVASTEKLVVSLGQIRRYKNLPLLVERFSESGDLDSRLIIAGACKSGALLDELTSVAPDDDRISIRAEHLGEEELVEIVAAADLFVTPFSKILNSSSVLMALSFDCPVLAPDLGALRELQGDVGEEWVYLYEGDLQTGDIEEVLDRTRDSIGEPNLSKYEWDEIGRDTAELFRTTIKKRATRMNGRAISSLKRGLLRRFEQHAPKLSLALRSRRAIRNGEYGLKLAQRYADGAKTSVDIGANKGIFSYWLSRSSGETVTIEPHPDCVRYLQKALGGRVTLISAACSDSTGYAKLEVPKEAGEENRYRSSLTKSFEGSGASVYQVPLVVLDQLGLENVGFIKIDVEGHEQEVLDGSIGLIRTCRPVVLIEAEERHRPGAVKWVAEYFADEDYYGYFLLGDRAIPINSFDLGVHQAEGADENDPRYVNNFLFLPAPIGAN